MGTATIRLSPFFSGGPVCDAKVMQKPLNVFDNYSFHLPNPDFLPAGGLGNPKSGF
jgi:hypothetical protein